MCYQKNILTEEQSAGEGADSRGQEKGWHWG